MLMAIYFVLLDVAVHSSCCAAFLYSDSLVRVCVQGSILASALLVKFLNSYSCYVQSALIQPKNPNRL